jgi:hypothetical protein
LSGSLRFSGMNYPLDRLNHCASVSDLKQELRALCSRFGAVMRLDVLMANLPGKRQAICLWRMESPEREEELMSEFGVGRFGGDLVMVVDLEPSDKPPPLSPLPESSPAPSRSARNRPRDSKR